MMSLGDDPRYTQEALAQMWDKSDHRVWMLRHRETDVLVESGRAKRTPDDLQWLYWDLNEGYVLMGTEELFDMFHLSP
jgi:hypothetical protein